MSTREEKLIYLDNATTSLKLTSFVDRLLNSYVDNSWIKDKEKYLESLRNKLSNWLRVEAKQIVFTYSSTYAVNEIFESLVKNWKGLSPIKFYISESEHISNSASLWSIREKDKNLIEIHNYSLEDKSEIKESVNSEGIILITPRDNLGNFSWNKSEIIQISKNNPKLLIVGDFTQSMMDEEALEMKNYFDYFYFSAHKILGPLGIGCIVMPRRSKLALKRNSLYRIDWRSIYVWEQEFENNHEYLKNYKARALKLINYWQKNFPSDLEFSYTSSPNSLIFLVKSSSHKIHDFAYLLEENKFVFRFNDLCSTNLHLSNRSIMRFSLSPLNEIWEIEKLFKLMEYFHKTIRGLK